MYSAKHWIPSFALLLALAPFVRPQTVRAKPVNDLQVYFADVEGGQSTLFVAHQMGKTETLLVDTGNPGRRRDADRIVALCKLAGITKIDMLLITHYHVDHVGGLPELVATMPVGTFVDHGPNRETPDIQGSKATIDGYNAYQKVLADSHATHLTVKPGDLLPLKLIHAEVVSADGAVLAGSLPGAGKPNPACAASPLKEAENTENDRSTGLILTYGKLRIADLGDLTWYSERPLMCPIDKLGKVDVYVVSHHGLDRSGSPALVDAIAPRVAIMDNGGHKGGAPATFETLRGSSRLKDIWQLHTAEANDAQHNSPESHIANLPGPDAANYLKLTGYGDGAFSVTNSRTGETVQYPAK
jgi:competence protein ComEC